MPTGLDAKFYYSATLISDNTQSGLEGMTWVEIPVARDIALNQPAGEADVSARNSTTRQREPTLLDAEVEAELKALPVGQTDAGLEAFRAAYYGRSKVAVLVLDGDQATIGTKGVAFNAHVMNFSRNEPLEDGMTYTVTLANGDELAAPWDKVGP